MLCESPTYVGAMSALQVFGPRWVEIPTDNEGMDVEAMERRLENCDRIERLIYVVPNFRIRRARPGPSTGAGFAEIVVKFPVVVVLAG